jgi:hypothetical protein
MRAARVIQSLRPPGKRARSPCASRGGTLQSDAGAVGGFRIVQVVGK